MCTLSSRGLGITEGDEWTRLGRLNLVASSCLQIYVLSLLQTSVFRGYYTFIPKADLIKANFFARPIFPFKNCVQTKWPKNQHKS